MRLPFTSTEAGHEPRQYWLRLFQVETQIVEDGDDPFVSVLGIGARIPAPMAVTQHKASQIALAYQRQGIAVLMYEQVAGRFCLVDDSGVVLEDLGRTTWLLAENAAQVYGTKGRPKPVIQQRPLDPGRGDVPDWIPIRLYHPAFLQGCVDAADRRRHGFRNFRMQCPECGEWRRSRDARVCRKDALNDSAERLRARSRHVQPAPTLIGMGPALQLLNGILARQLEEPGKPGALGGPARYLRPINRRDLEKWIEDGLLTVAARTQNGHCRFCEAELRAFGSNLPALLLARPRPGRPRKPQVLVKIREATEAETAALREMAAQGEGQVALRARMVLLALEGASLAEIARAFSLTEGAVSEWIIRFNRDGVAGIRNKPGSGRPRKHRADSGEGG